MDDKRIHKIVVLKHGNHCSVIGIKHITQKKTSGLIRRQWHLSSKITLTNNFIDQCDYSRLKGFNRAISNSLYRTPVKAFVQHLIHTTKSFLNVSENK